ncbi:MAG TPA: choice-of-anchor D domain-containing protein, partial [Methylomirabilota bacterium]|nr:choice-of-anchor D domain-containing protein [Methylomirabilota bacterium]
MLALASAAPPARAGSLSLGWNAPTTNANGSPLTDLAQYRVYFGTSTPACPGQSFRAVGSPTPSPTTGEVVNYRLTGLAGGTSYTVRVTAVDQSGNESGCSAAVAAVAQADVAVTPTTSVSFGTVALNTSVDRTFSVQNTGTATVSGTAATAAPFSVVSGGSFSLAPGAIQAVVVRFRPTATGTFAGNVTFSAGGDVVSRAVSGDGSGSAAPVLTVTRAGTGTGTVTSSPSGINCGTTCSASFTTSVTLSALPASGSTFAGWSGGGCSGTGTCSLTLTANTGVTATFNTSVSEAPAPTVSSLVPSSATAGSPALTLTVNGANFTSASVVRWDGVARTTTYVGGTQLRAAISATDLATAGSHQVTVSTPAPGGGTSSALTFTVDGTTTGNPVPVLTSTFPASVRLGNRGGTLYVYGRNFVSSATVRWNGANRATTFVSGTELRASIPASDVAAAGTYLVTVANPAPGGGISNAVTFTVRDGGTSGAPAPSATSLSPASAT